MSGPSGFVCRECDDKECTLVVSDGEYPIHCPPHGPLDDASFERFDTITTKLAIADAAIEMFRANGALKSLDSAGDIAGMKANFEKHKKAHDTMYDLCRKLEATS